MGPVVHPLAKVYPGVRLGDDVRIDPFCVIGSRAEIRGQWRGEGDVIVGDRTEIREFTAVQGPARIGADCFIMDKVHIAHDNVIGDDVTIAPGTMLAGHVTIGRYAWLGLNVSVNQRINIGTGAMVGSGSVVTKDVAPWRMVYGNPARDHGWNFEGLKRHGLNPPD